MKKLLLFVVFLVVFPKIYADEAYVVEKHYPINIFFDRFPLEVQMVLANTLSLCRDIIDSDSNYSYYENFDDGKKLGGEVSFSDVKKYPLWVSDKFIREADLTGDGVSDYIIDSVGVDCRPLASWTGGKYSTYYIFQGLKSEDGQDKKAVLIRESAHHIPDSAYIKLLPNEQGYFDIGYIGEGEICGQPSDEATCWACLWRCNVIETWHKKTNQFIPIRRLKRQI